MKIRLLIGGFVLGAAAAMITAQAISQDAQPSQDQAMAEMMAMWEKMAKPGEKHRVLDSLVGDWKSTTQILMPGAEPMLSNGTASFEWVLNGTFLKNEEDSSYMGMPMQGLGFMGFDNYKKKYTLAWMNSLGTAMLTAEGLLDMTGKQITFFGPMDEWMTGEHDKMVKYVYRIIDEDHFVFEMHDLGIVPGETKVIQIDYHRATE